MQYKRNKKYQVVHPCIDNLNGKLTLKIFRYMFKELTLPKFIKQGSKEAMMNPDTMWVMNHSASAASQYDDETALSIKKYVDAISARAAVTLTRWERFKHKLFRQEVDVEKTMDDAKANVSSLSNNLEEEQKAVDKLIERAKQSSQVGLVEQLLKYKNVIAGHIALKKNGYDKFVSEASVIEFIKKSHRGVRLDFIRNYKQFIPFAVIDKKSECDDLEVFDNYCVLYYDPSWESWGDGKTRIDQDHKANEEAIRQANAAEAERMRRWSRDPILFGMIEGSRNLYYVADWVTDDDDLTLEKLNLVVENATQYIDEFNHDAEETYAMAIKSLKEAILEIKSVDYE